MSKRVNNKKGKKSQLKRNGVIVKKRTSAGYRHVLGFDGVFRPVPNNLKTSPVEKIFDAIGFGAKDPRKTIGLSMLSRLFQP